MCLFNRNKHMQASPPPQPKNTKNTGRIVGIVLLIICIVTLVIILVFIFVFRQVCLNSSTAVAAMRDELRLYTTGPSPEARIPSDQRLYDLVDGIRNFAGQAEPPIPASTCDSLPSRAREYVQHCMPSYNAANCSGDNPSSLCRTLGVMPAAIYGVPCYPIQSVPVRFPDWKLPDNPADDSAPLVTS